MNNTRYELYQNGLREINAEIAELAQKINNQKQLEASDYYQNLQRKKRELQIEIDGMRKAMIASGQIKRGIFDARQDAWNRFHGMNKVKQTMAKINGQYAKLKKLDKKAKKAYGTENKELMGELDGMFRSM